MSTMQTFRSVLVSASNSQDQHLEALAALTTMALDQLKTLASGLGWQEWNPQSPKANATS